MSENTNGGFGDVLIQIAHKNGYFPKTITTFAEAWEKYPDACMKISHSKEFKNWAMDRIMKKGK